MKTFIIRFFLNGKNVMIFLLIMLFAFQSMAASGFDFYATNDQSGSTDACENLQSLQFNCLVTSFPPGYNKKQGGAAAASWNSSNKLTPHSFVFIGAGYPTQLSAVGNYHYSQTFFANANNVLQKAGQNIKGTFQTGRSVNQIIVSMTEASVSEIIESWFAGSHRHK